MKHFLNSQQLQELQFESQLEENGDTLRAIVPDWIGQLMKWVQLQDPGASH